MLEYPLTKANRIHLAWAYRQVPRVDLSIECAIEGQMGRAYVDRLENPTVFKIQVGPFVYFAGDAASPAALEMLQGISPYLLLMPSAPGWIERCRDLYGERLVGFDRYSFVSDGLSLPHLEGLVQESKFRADIKPMDLAFARRLWGQDHFVDLSDFDSAEDFAARGVGFYVEREYTTAGAAFSSLVCSQGIEVSVFVVPEYRRQGLATALAARLAARCLERQADAHWDAANPESCALAVKLGYTPEGQYLACYLVE